MMAESLDYECLIVAINVEKLMPRLLKVGPQLFLENRITRAG